VEDVVEDILRGEIPPIPPESRIFVNRNLRLSHIDMVGFDLDYTLAVYKTPEFDRLCLEKTIEKLVKERGYPPAIAAVLYDPEMAQRGLIVDSTNGNIIKMDRFNHVWRAVHGLTPFTHEQVIESYRRKLIDYSDKTRFNWLDTLFSLTEVSLYSSMIDMLDRKDPDLSRYYGRVFTDIRECTDEAHRDDSIKCVVKSDPAKYIEKSAGLAPTLHRFRSDGKKLFLLTNSGWEYTSAVMSYLLNGEMREYPSWMDYFEIIVVDAQKPGFFSSQERFHLLDRECGRFGPCFPHELERGRVYARGNLELFEALSGCGGDRILYVGDHIYGDIMLSKSSSLWRTAMIVPELEKEIAVSSKLAGEFSMLASLEKYRVELETKASRTRLAHNIVESRQRKGNGADEARLAGLHDTLTADMERYRDELARLRDQHGRLQSVVQDSYNRRWGSLFREQNEVTKFGEQVGAFACVYTSQVTNFRYYSPRQYFLAPRIYLPHEKGE
jgi:HAD superfamily 5'-nucleotidase-like hydrolase